MYPFDTVNYNNFNAKPKPLEDKMIPDSMVSLKIAKKHLPTQEIKDRIIRESLEALTLYLAANAQSMSFPELVVPTCVMLRKFKKNVNHHVYSKSVQSLLELIKRNEDMISTERAKIRDKSLRDPANLTKQFALQVKSLVLPLVKEGKRLEDRQTERIH
jgi:hypothetical protein